MNEPLKHKNVERLFRLIRPCSNSNIGTLHIPDVIDRSRKPSIFSVNMNPEAITLEK